MSQHFDQDTLRDMIDRTLNESRGLTDWERHFIESISEQLDRRGILSAKQEEILERIYIEKV